MSKILWFFQTLEFPYFETSPLREALSSTAASSAAPPKAASAGVS